MSYCSWIVLNACMCSHGILAELLKAARYGHKLYRAHAFSIGGGDAPADICPSINLGTEMVVVTVLLSTAH